MMGRSVLLVAAAAVVAALVVFAVWLTAVATPPPKPLVPITNGTFTALYNATVICVDGRKTWDLTLVYRNGKLIRAMLDGREIPLAVFKYPHGLSYVGELLLDLNRIKDVNNETLKPLGGHNQQAYRTSRASCRLAARAPFQTIRHDEFQLL